MSSSLMSCVRENSPPLHLDTPNVIAFGHKTPNNLKYSPTETLNVNAGDGNRAATTATTVPRSEGTCSITEQQKRRRFHPLRNLRRIFRRRTITSVIDTPINIVPCSFNGSNNHRTNLRCATYSIASPVVDLTSLRPANLTAPSTATPPLEAPSSYSSQSLPKYRPYTTAITLPANTSSIGETVYNTARLEAEREWDMSTAAAPPPVNAIYHHHHHQHQRQHQQQSLSSSSSYAERSQTSHRNEAKNASNNLRGGEVANGCHDNAIGGEMAKSELNFNKPQMMDRTCRQQNSLSQSHDSVFSETVTSNNDFSVILKKELSSVLNKRRNVMQTSSEESGLGIRCGIAQSEVEGQWNGSHFNRRRSREDEMSVLMRDLVGGPIADRHKRAQTLACAKEFEISNGLLKKRDTSSTLDLSDEMNFISSTGRLSHAAAKHKMAIRPTKKKIPSRLQHNSPKIPSNSNPVDNINKINISQKPLGLGFKPFLQSPELKDTFQYTSTKTEMRSAMSTYETWKNENSETKIVLHEKESASDVDLQPSEVSYSCDQIKNSTIESVDNIHLDRAIPRNSKRSISRLSNSISDLDASESEPKKLQISTSCFDTQGGCTPIPTGPRARSSTDFEQNIKETRKDIKREIMSEGKNGLSAMLNSFEMELHSRSSQMGTPAHLKAKSTLDTWDEEVDSKRVKTKTFKCVTKEQHYRTTQLNSLHDDKLPPVKPKQMRDNSSVLATEPPQPREYLLERKPRIVGLSAFQQRVFQSNANDNQSDNLVDTPPIKAMRRKSIEKSRSFRISTENHEYTATPSLPDLSVATKVPTPTDAEVKRNLLSPKINSVNLKQEAVYEEHRKQNTKVTSPVLAFNSGPTKLTSTNLSKSFNDLNSNQNNSAHETEYVMHIPFHSPTIIHETESKVFIKGDCGMISPKVGIKMRPKSLNLKEEEVNLPNNSEGSSPAHLRSKPIASSFQDLLDEVQSCKNVERKSAPPLSVTMKSPAVSPTHRTGPIESKTNDVPEFMKIQLNHVDHARLTKPNIAYVKNTKEIPFAPINRSSTFTDINLRRYSSDSLEIDEKTPLESEREAALNVPVVNSFNDKVNPSEELNGSLSERHAINKAIVMPAMPKPIVIRDVCRSASAQTPLAPVIKTLQERKRIFIEQETAKSLPKKVEEIRTERKKSLNAEIPQKIVAKSEKIENAISNGTLPMPNPAEATTADVVVLRKKSLANVQEANASRKSSMHGDVTPELMKVFARRSMKVRDETVTVSDPLASSTNTNIPPMVVASTKLTRASNEQVPHKSSTTATHQSQNGDSDKENHFAKEKIFTKRQDGYSNDTQPALKSDEKLAQPILQPKEKVHRDQSNIVATSLTAPSSASQPISVVLRKKSFGVTQHSNLLNSNNNNNNIKDDSTPELMKVFARRSLKTSEDVSNQVTKTN